MEYTTEYWDKVIKGVKNGKQAFCGPHTVQIDLTDKCNNSCIGCWVHSPLVEAKESFPEGEKELPFKKVEKFIESLHRLGTKEIILSGSGEPFMYRDILKVIRLIKSRGMYLNIITNGSFLDNKTSEFLVKSGVDLITISVWAGSIDTYIKSHPTKATGDFNKLKSNLKNLSSFKCDCFSFYPHVKIYNVIYNGNCGEIEIMVDFAKDVDADSIEFHIIDIIKGKTDRLALRIDDIKKVITQFDNLRKRKDMVFFTSDRTEPLDNFTKKEFSDLGKIWKDYKKGFSVDKCCFSIRCKKNLVIDGNPDSHNQRLIISESNISKGCHPHVFWYKFKSELCKKCEDRNDCLEHGAISVKLLNILGVGSFIRRCFSPSSEKGIYEKAIKEYPCYIGWYYARVLTNGNVIPCCKAAAHPLGNIFKNSFTKIWHSGLYNEFRFKAKSLSKDNSYFSKIDCIRSCDNWGMNLEVTCRLEEFDYREFPPGGKNTNKITIPAKNFVSGNFNKGNHEFGENLIIDGGEEKGFALYNFTVKKQGEFEFWSRYASGQSRPADIYIDGRCVKEQGLNRVTYGWIIRFLRWNKEFDLELKEGKHILEIRSVGFIPHIEKFVILGK